MTDVPSRRLPSSDITEVTKTLRKLEKAADVLTSAYIFNYLEDKHYDALERARVEAARVLGELGSRF